MVVVLSQNESDDVEAGCYYRGAGKHPLGQIRLNFAGTATMNPALMSSSTSVQCKKEEQERPQLHLAA